MPLQANSPVTLGVDRLFTPQYAILLHNKRIGLVTNHTAINGQLQTTARTLKAQSKAYSYTFQALFAPEHGLTGNQYAYEKVESSKDPDGIPIYSLHGETRRPTPAMLKDLDLIIYDIQDIGTRSYTYITTLFYVMEEAAKIKLPVIVLDRPNPINGIVVDGTMLEEKWRSMVGYINVPYCHGMTIGELALYFNAEYNIHCPLTVIPMQGWRREMTFQDTGLTWIPTSPQIPEATTAFYYPMTGLLGELQLVNIGVGYTLPFKLIGAPWINAAEFARQLNAQHLPGITFYPFYFRPFFGRYANENCEGVHLIVTHPLLYQPATTQYVIIGILKSLYPQFFAKAMSSLNAEKEKTLHKITGTEAAYQILKTEKYVAWPLKALHKNERAAFLKKRMPYLLYK
jgi:uncharacterized protein YbbC (DUF1343 family)